jgi:hypothetical protein
MTTTKKKKRVTKRVNNDLVLRYEDAWNYIVSHMPTWKQEIVINMTPEEAEEKGVHERAADIFNEMAKEVRKLAESNRKIPPPKENWHKPE